MKTKKAPQPSGSVNGMLFMAFLILGLFVLYGPGLKTRATSPFAAAEVQMKQIKPLIIIPDVASQIPTEPAPATDSPWWNKPQVAANLEKIAKAIKSYEAMTNHQMRANHLHPERLTLHTKDGDVFVEIKGDTVRVGDLVDGKQIVGTLDGAMPTSGAQDLSPDDSIGYPPSISGDSFGQQGVTAVSRKAYTPMWYEETIKRVADAVLTPP